MNAIRQTAMPPAMILCGGRGTRLMDVAELLPKPMVAIGEFPIVWHVMRSFAAFGVKRFILCLGYKREAFVDYFVNYLTRTSDVTVSLNDNSKLKFHSGGQPLDWEVTLAGTGLDSMTGCRVFRAAKYLAPDDRNFFLTYGDGVADINIEALYRQHTKSGKLITISAVHPEARFGEIVLDGNDVLRFDEKPPHASGYINGGYMMVERNFVARYLADDESLFFERAPMRRAAEDHQMQVFKHEGFWQCMDNPREYELLNSLWRSGAAPWTKYWK